MREIEDPLVAPPPPEIPLKDAPLVRVIAQVRFPEILSIEQRDFVAPFQEGVRTEYPVLRAEQTQGVMLGAAGFVQAKPQTAWRFNDVDGRWRVSLTPEFLALETTTYTSRSDFLARLRKVLEALEEHVAPKSIDRLGIRYIDQIVGKHVDGISSLVRAEVRGIVGTTAATHVTHTLAETMFSMPEAKVVARWGQLPAGVTVDPAAIEPRPERSWVLDLDMSSVGSTPFVVDKILADAESYAKRIYTIFRWAVTDEFLRIYGGAS